MFSKNLARVKKNDKYQVCPGPTKVFQKLQITQGYSLKSFQKLRITDAYGGSPLGLSEKAGEHTYCSKSFTDAGIPM